MIEGGPNPGRLAGEIGWRARSAGGRDRLAAASEDWDAGFRLNVTAPMWLCRGAIPHVRAVGHGSIVNVSSRAAERASPGLAAYVASKGALNALTRSLAVAQTADGIRANTVSPGYVLNERRDADLDDAGRARLEAMHLTRLATPEDVAAAVAFLAGPDAETITGILRPVDGGSSTAARATSLGWRPGRWGHVQSPRCPTTKICSTRSATVLPG